MSLDARSDPHTVYAAVLRGFGLTRSELPPPHDGDGEVTPEGVGRDLVAAGTTDPYERLLETITHSEHGVAAPRHYWSEAPAQHLGGPLSAFGYEFDLKTKPTGDGRTVGAVLRTDATTRRMTYTYPEDGDGADTYPALIHAIERRLLPEAGPTFVRLADDGDAWRFALVERWRLAELQERLGDRVEVFGEPLLAAYQPADLAGEGERPGDVESVSVPTEPLEDAFERMRRTAVTDPVSAGSDPIDLETDLDREAAAALRNTGATLAAETDPGDDTDADGRPPSSPSEATDDGAVADRRDTADGARADDDTLWSPNGTDEPAPERPRKRYADSGTSDADPVTERGRFVPSDPPEMGVDAADSGSSDGDPHGSDTGGDRSGRHVAHDADSVADLPESVTLDRSHATRVTGEGLPFVADEPDATVLGDDSDADTLSDAAEGAFVFGDDRADGTDATDSRSGSGSTGPDEPSARVGRETPASSDGPDTPLSQQVATTLGDPGDESSTESTPAAGATAPTSGREGDDSTSTTADHVPREWAGDDDADSTERPDGDVLSAITEWVENER